MPFIEDMLGELREHDTDRLVNGEMLYAEEQSYLAGRPKTVIQTILAFTPVDLPVVILLLEPQNGETILRMAFDENGFHGPTAEYEGELDIETGKLRLVIPHPLRFKERIKAVYRHKSALPTQITWR
jgi:hypothetical protein